MPIVYSKLIGNFEIRERAEYRGALAAYSVRKNSEVVARWIWLEVVIERFRILHLDCFGKLPPVRQKFGDQFFGGILIDGRLQIETIAQRANKYCLQLFVVSMLLCARDFCEVSHHLFTPETVIVHEGNIRYSWRIVKLNLTGNISRCDDINIESALLNNPHRLTLNGRLIQGANCTGIAEPLFFGCNHLGGD